MGLLSEFRLSAHQPSFRAYTHYLTVQVSLRNLPSNCVHGGTRTHSYLALDQTRLPIAAHERVRYTGLEPVLTDRESVRLATSGISRSGGGDRTRVCMAYEAMLEPLQSLRRLWRQDLNLQPSG